MKRRIVFSGLLVILSCMVIGLTARSAGSSRAMASILNRGGTATAQATGQSWALVEIAKPAYTASPTTTPIPTTVNTLEPTFTPALAYAEIIQDTPTAQVSTIAENPPANSGQVPLEPLVASYAGGKTILVDISQQHLYAYEGDSLVYSFVASTGMNNATAVGNFSVLSKIPNAYGATWDIWMPDWLGIYWAAGLQNGIHALPILPSGAQLWSGFLGTPISYGCVVLGAYEAQLLYDWAEIGTPVEIRW